METDKLMIGSHVLANINGAKREIVVSAISEGGVCEVSSIKEPRNPNAPYDRIWISKNDIEPISITEEVLARCNLYISEDGKTKNKTRAGKSISGMDCILCEEGHIELRYDINEYTHAMKYLHELQLVYKIMTDCDLFEYLAEE